MIWGRRVAGGLLCAGVALLFPEGARAQPKDEVAARALFDEARRLGDAGQYAQACPKLEEARRLFTSAGLIFNLADCYEKVGRTSDARSTFDEAARVATESGRADLAAEAARRRDALKVASAPPARVDAGSTPPSAPSGDERVARALFEEGRALRDAGRYDAACEKFEAASKRFVSAGVVLNLADCYAKVGRTASAWTSFRDAASVARQTQRPDIEVSATRGASEIEPKLMRLVIHVPHDVPGLVLRRDNIFLPRVSWEAAAPVDPGTHEVRAEAPGHEPWSATATVSTPGDTVAIEVPELRALAAEPSPAPAVQARPNPPAAASPAANAVDEGNHPAPARETPPTAAAGPEHAWIDADVGGAYTDVTLFNASALSLEKSARGGPTFSFAAGVRFDALTLGVRVRDLALSAYNVWEVDGEGALHTRFDRFDAHVGFRGGYAILSGVSGVSGLNMGAFFGFDYYVAPLFSLGLDVCPELLWLQGTSQASLGFGFEATARAGLHF